MPNLEDPVASQFAGKIRNLVFEGGGVWGIAYEGALLELDRFRILPDVRRVAGASAGAITAALIAVGYSPAELGAVLRSTNFKSFMDQDWGYARDTARLLTEFGWYKGDLFKDWMRERIARKVSALSKQHGVAAPGKSPRLGELAKWQAALATRGVRLPAPYLVGTNLSRQRREIYSAEHSPDVRLDDAVRRSMSIPLFFACARGGEAGNKKDVIVDGGLTWNYPINVFDDRRYADDARNALAVPYATHADHVFNAETLGFRVDTTRELQLNLKDWANEPVKIDNIVHFGWAIVTFIRAIANKVHLHKNDWSRTIFVDVGEEVGFTDFELGDPQKEALSRAGRDGVRKYFEWATSSAGRAEIARVRGTA